MSEINEAAHQPASAIDRKSLFHFKSGLGDMTNERMLNKPLFFTLQVSLWHVGGDIENGCNLLLNEGNVSPTIIVGNDSANPGLCPKSWSIENVPYRPSTTSGTLTINWCNEHTDLSGLDDVAKERMLNTPLFFTLQVNYKWFMQRYHSDDFYFFNQVHLALLDVLLCFV